MTKIFKSNSTIFYFTHSSVIKESGVYDVILSPEFYWVKKVNLPVKKIRAAKNLAESVYAGSLPEGDFVYEVSKSGDEFIIIAYDKDKIAKEISKKFIKNAKVSAIYFAQNEFSELEGCCGVDESNSLINLNSLILQVPRVCTESKKDINDYLKDKKLSKNRVTLSSFEGSIIGTKELYLIASGVFLLFVSFSADLINYKGAIKELEEQKSQIVAQNSLPQTSMQLKSIKQSLIKTYERQKKMRDEIFALNGLNLQKGEFIESINTNPKETVVVIKVSSKDREKDIKAKLLKTVKIKSANFANSRLTLKIDS